MPEAIIFDVDGTLVDFVDHNARAWRDAFRDHGHAIEDIRSQIGKGCGQLMEAAGKAGLRGLGLLCGGFPEQGLRNAGCIAIYRSPADLLAQNDRSPLARDGVGR